MSIDRYNDQGTQIANFLDVTQISELYHSASFLNSAVRKQNQLNTVRWPPDHHDLSIQHCLQSIPPPLFNHMAILTGYVDPLDTSPERASSTYFNVDESHRSKLVEYVKICFFVAVEHDPRPNQ